MSGAAETGEAGAGVPPFSLHYGGPAPEVVVAGHSHALSMIRAMSADPSPGIALAYTTELVDGPSLEDAYWEFVAAHCADRVVAVSWNGNQHHASFLIAPDPPIALWSPDRGVLAGVAPGEAVPVSRSTLREYWDWSFVQLHTALSLLGSARRVVMLETPPPKRDATVRANLATEVWFAQVARDLGVAVDELPICDEDVRYAMWEVIRDATIEIAREYDVPMLHVPRHVLDEDGFLLPEFSAADATHANDDFGDEMVRTLLSEVRR